MDPIARLIRDPLLILDGAGRILETNPKARRLLGHENPSACREVFEIDEGYRALLSEASRSSEPALGALRLRAEASSAKRIKAQALMVRRGPPPVFAVQLLFVDPGQFAALNERLSALNQEVRIRRAAQAQLEEALAQNRTLYRELQHRVKNHLQMVLGLFSSAAREVKGDDGSGFLIDRLQAQLAAVVEAQRLMYLSTDAAAMPADDMLRRIVDATRTLAGDRVQIHCQAEPLQVGNDAAFPLALIANELLSNALKHGPVGENARIDALLTRVDAEGCLEVRDNGPGFQLAETGRRSSGLGLVRGLSRQIGGRLEIETEQGACVRVTFPLRS